MLRPHGEVNISHKIGGPFCKWNLEELAAKNSLVLVERVNFSVTDYPGYNNKRGDGPKCDQPFPLGECCTYKFRIGHFSKKKPSSNPISLGGSTSDGAPGVVGRPMTQFLVNAQGIPGTVNCAPTIEMINGFSSLPEENISNEQSHSRRISPDYVRLNQDPLGNSSELYMNDNEVRTILGNLRYLEDLHRWSIMRQAQLHGMLFRLDQEGRGPSNTEEGLYLW